MSTTTLRRSARILTSTKALDDAGSKEISKPKVLAPKKRSKEVNTTKPSLSEPVPVPAPSAAAKPDNSLTTPLRKKRKTTEKIPNGENATPPTATAAARPASPHATNAPLASSSGPVIVAAPSSAQKRKVATAVPDMGALGPANTTVETVLSDAEAFLVSVDPKLKTLVEKHRCDVFTPEGLRQVVEPFEKLASGIIGQQVRSVVLHHVFGRVEMPWFVGCERGRCNALCYTDTYKSALEPWTISLLTSRPGLRSGCLFDSQKIHCPLPVHTSSLPLTRTGPHTRHRHAAHCGSVSAQGRVHPRASREVCLWRAEHRDAGTGQRR
jgi:hypothetical protein